MIFLTVFLAALLANAITVGCVYGFMRWQSMRRAKAYTAAFEHTLDGLHRMMNDINKDEEVRH